MYNKKAEIIKIDSILDAKTFSNTLNHEVRKMEFFQWYEYYDNLQRCGKKFTSMNKKENLLSVITLMSDFVMAKGGYVKGIYQRSNNDVTIVSKKHIFQIDDAHNDIFDLGKSNEDIITFESFCDEDSVSGISFNRDKSISTYNSMQKKIDDFGANGVIKSDNIKKISTSNFFFYLDTLFRNKIYNSLIVLDGVHYQISISALFFCVACRENLKSHLLCSIKNFGNGDWLVIKADKNEVSSSELSLYLPLTKAIVYKSEDNEFFYSIDSRGQKKIIYAFDFDENDYKSTFTNVDEYHKIDLEIEDKQDTENPYQVYYDKRFSTLGKSEELVKVYTEPSDVVFEGHKKGKSRLFVSSHLKDNWWRKEYQTLLSELLNKYGTKDDKDFYKDLIEESNKNNYINDFDLKLDNLIQLAKGEKKKYLGKVKSSMKTEDIKQLEKDLKYLVNNKTKILGDNKEYIEIADEGIKKIEETLASLKEDKEVKEKVASKRGKKEEPTKEKSENEEMKESIQILGEQVSKLSKLVSLYKRDADSNKDSIELIESQIVKLNKLKSLYEKQVK